MKLSQFPPFPKLEATTFNVCGEAEYLIIDI